MNPESQETVWIYGLRDVFLRRLIKGLLWEFATSSSTAFKPALCTHSGSSWCENPFCLQAPTYTAI